MSISPKFSHQGNTTVLSITLCLLTFFFSTAHAVGSGEKHSVLDVSDISAWEHKSFASDTIYSKSTMAEKACIKAESHQSASGLFKKTKIDLNKTPIMHWNWFVNKTLGDINEEEKPGDDYVARLYVVISGGMFFWNTRALNYVWASRKPRNSTWANAFSSNATMLAVESGTENLGRWVHESRDVKDDIKNLLDIDTQFIDAVAIMTDTDNSGKSAVACYGEIFFDAR